MLKIYLYKCFLILYISTFSITYTLSSEESEKETSAVKRSREESASVSENQVEKPEESVSKKKPRVKKDEADEEREASEGEAEEDRKLEASDPIPPEGSITKAAEIGTWVGDKENGIANLQLSYKGTLISEEIKKWHLEMGTQIQQIANLRGLKKNKLIIFEQELISSIKKANHMKLWEHQFLSYLLVATLIKRLDKRL
jgi:hypothetical protein